MLAFVSYLPLCGNGGSRGDGIIPLEVALLEGATQVELPTSKHSGQCSHPLGAANFRGSSTPLVVSCICFLPHDRAFRPNYQYVVKYLLFSIAAYALEKTGFECPTLAV